MPSSQTIAALSSGALPSGVAVVRVSGASARTVLRTVCASVPTPRRASLRRLLDDEGRVIDQGVVLFFDGPNTATGEDIAEFHLHGGRAVVAAFLQRVTAIPGVRLASAGEFTRRAFDNGRIDLTEAEGLSDLLLAETETQRRAAQMQAGGGLRTLYDGWMERLTRARAMIEASLDFADEGDVDDAVDSGVAAEIRDLAQAVRAHLAKAGRGEILRGGFHVAIVGAPNVGKSSLLNALAEREVAIVTDIPGTTRDVIEVVLDLGGVAVRFSDTAGIRDTSDQVEAIGVERARTVMAEAHLVLLLRASGAGGGGDASMFHVKHSPLSIDETVIGTRPLLNVRTKIDLDQATERDDPAEADHAISTRTGEGLSELASAIAHLAAEAAGDPDEAVPMRARHREILADVVRLLALLDRDAPLAPELVAETLRDASWRLGQLTGQVDVEDLLDVIFSAFCIGK